MDGPQGCLRAVLPSGKARGLDLPSASLFSRRASSAPTRMQLSAWRRTQQRSAPTPAWARSQLLRPNNGRRIKGRAHRTAASVLSAAVRKSPVSSAAPSSAMVRDLPQRELACRAALPTDMVGDKWQHVEEWQRAWGSVEVGNWWRCDAGATGAHRFGADGWRCCWAGCIVGSGAF